MLIPWACGRWDGSGEAVPHMTTIDGVSASTRSRPQLCRWVWGLAALQVVALVATSARYGYHRDELYFIVAGGHPAFGYPDQPPIVPLVSWAMHALAHSLVLLRLPSALLAGATTVMAGLIAREVTRSHRAHVIAAACTAVSGFALAIGHIVSTTTFDLASTTAFGLLVIRAVMRDRPANLVGAGLVVGIGVEAKPQVGLVAIVAVVALLAIGPRRQLLTRAGLAGAVLAIVIAAPYVVWQQAHGWPQLTVASNVAGSAEGGRAGFIPFQLVMVSPLLVPVWVAGWAAPFRRPALRGLRFISVSYLALAVTYLAGDGKAYYLASLYPVLLGIGALPVAEWTMASGRRVGVLVVAIVASAAVSAVIALPVLPASDLPGSAVMALNPDQGETVGWPRFLDAVTGAWRGLPAGVRSHTAIFTANYGEAGAIDVLGDGRLPRAYSGHNGFALWGQPPATDTSALVVGYDSPSDAAPAFRACRVLAIVNNGLGLNNQEQGLPVMICQTDAPWSAMWPSLTHFN